MQSQHDALLGFPLVQGTSLGDGQLRPRNCLQYSNSQIHMQMTYKWIHSHLSQISLEFTIYRVSLEAIIKITLDLWANICQMHHVNLTFDLAGDNPSRRYGSSSSICTPSLKFIGLSVRKILSTSGLNISRPGNLDLWPWNWFALLPVRCTTFPQILVFLRSFVLDLSANSCQTRHVTLRPWPLR